MYWTCYRNSKDLLMYDKTYMSYKTSKILGVRHLLEVGLTSGRYVNDKADLSFIRKSVNFFNFVLIQMYFNVYVFQ